MAHLNEYEKQELLRATVIKSNSKAYRPRALPHREDIEFATFASKFIKVKKKHKLWW